MSTQGLTKAGKIYLAAVIATGSAVISLSIYHLVQEPIGIQWFILAALTVVSGSASVRLPSSPASISISETFVITGVLLYGPEAGTVLTALDGLVLSFWMSRRHTEAHRALFNVSAPALSAWCSAHLFFIVSGIPPLVQQPASVNAILPALILFALTYFGLNSWLVTFVIAIERQLDPVRIWTSNFLLLSLNYFAGASVAILFVGFTRTIDLGYVGIILPLLLVLYFTFKATMSRVEDANKHVDELNRLYLSTIETFAMAIDAKDQVTHGHIRRVQQHAISLAREIGVRDTNLLKAIEAAALLHDMGKLAVPEYILNKPGKLTETEFAKMKLHAAVGADILSAVDFPYPVVPIVRHHHENWDGSGYPVGLRGTAIPLGARILSVVDCFDALTSDRPYRPRLPDDEALKIVLERRGTMYDPMIVDAFTRIHNRVTPLAPNAGPGANVLTEIASSRTQSQPPITDTLHVASPGAGDVSLLLELQRILIKNSSLNDACRVLLSHVHRLVPSSICVLYTYDRLGDNLELTHAVGEGASSLAGIRIQVGQRLSGWVAANRQTICNSDPALDFGDLANARGLALRSCLSVAIAHDDNLIGVLSVYSGEARAFSDNHRRTLETVVHHVSPTLDAVASLQHSDQRDSHVLRPITVLEQVVRQSAEHKLNTISFALVLIEVFGLDLVDRKYGHEAVNDVVRHVVRLSKQYLRETDLMGRSSRNEFVVLLSTTDRESAVNVATRVHQRLASHSFSTSEGLRVNIDSIVTPVFAPEDGVTLEALCAVARQKSRLVQSARTFHIH